MKIGSSARVPVLSEFSRLPEKRELYAVDPYYREGWEDMLEAWGDSALCARRLKRIAPIIFRPDAVVTRSIPRALALLSERGFTPIAARRFRYNRHSDVSDGMHFEWIGPPREERG